MRTVGAVPATGNLESQRANRAEDRRIPQSKKAAPALSEKCGKGATHLVRSLMLDDIIDDLAKRPLAQRRDSVSKRRFFFRVSSMYMRPTPMTAWL